MDHYIVYKNRMAFIVSLLLRLNETSLHTSPTPLSPASRGNDATCTRVVTVSSLPGDKTVTSHPSEQLRRL